MSGDAQGRGAGGRITDLWRLGPSEVVAVVGAGGKTSLLEALARDYEAEGALVLLTTTTKILPPPPGSRPLVLGGDLQEVADRLRALAGGRGADRGPAPSPVVGRGLTANGKVDGVPPEWVPELRDLPGVEAVIVEADGAAGRPLKAPAAWEPVVPQCASLVVVVVGLDGQGAPLDAEHVHRPDSLGALLGLEPGSAVPPASLLRAAVAGYAGRVPAHAGLLVLLNKADEYPPERTLSTAAARAPVEVWSGAVGGRSGHGLRRLDTAGAGSSARGRPPAVVLAAGLGRRMGGEKVLAALGEGTVLGRVVEAAVRSEVLGEVVVVAGRGREGTERVLARVRPAPPGGDGSVGPVVRVVENPAPEEGMASSLRAGLRALVRPDGVLVLLGDQPLVRPETLRRLVAERAGRPRAAAVGLAGGPGGVRPPVLLHRSLVPRALELRGDEGARHVLARHPGRSVAVVGAPEETLDVDTRADLAEARRIAASMGDGGT